MDCDSKSMWFRTLGVEGERGEGEGGGGGGEGGGKREGGMKYRGSDEEEGRGKEA